MGLDVSREALLRRADELERRAWEGVDDVGYCLRWAGIHRRLAALRD